MAPSTSSARARTVMSMGDSLPSSPVPCAASLTLASDSSEQSDVLRRSPQRARRGSSWLASSLRTPTGQT